MDGDGHILLRFLPKAVTGTASGSDFSKMLNVVTTRVPSCSSTTVPSFPLLGDSQVRRAAAALRAPASAPRAAVCSSLRSKMEQWGADKHPFCPYLGDHLLAAARHGRRCWAAEGPLLC